jgi:hypothetical protein
MSIVKQEGGDKGELSGKGGREGVKESGKEKQES